MYPDLDVKYSIKDPLSPLSEKQNNGWILERIPRTLKEERHRKSEKVYEIKKIFRLSFTVKWKVSKVNLRWISGNFSTPISSSVIILPPLAPGGAEILKHAAVGLLWFAEIDRRFLGAGEMQDGGRSEEDQHQTVDMLDTRWHAALADGCQGCPVAHKYKKKLKFGPKEQKDESHNKGWK